MLSNQFGRAVLKDFKILERSFVSKLCPFMCLPMFVLLCSSICWCKCLQVKPTQFALHKPHSNLYTTVWWFTTGGLFSFGFRTVSIFLLVKTGWMFLRIFALDTGSNVGLDSGRCSTSQLGRDSTRDCWEMEGVAGM